MTAVTEATEHHKGPPNSETADGKRWYIHPLTGERFISVTTVLGIVAKDRIPGWSARKVAEAAMDRAAELAAAADRDPCKPGEGEPRCGVCPTCMVKDLRTVPEDIRDEAGDLGRRLHDAAEMYELARVLPEDPEIAALFAQYLAWRAQFKPRFEAAEMTVISREHGYGGTLDGLLRYGWLPPKWRHLRGQVICQDTKTSRFVYRTVAMQLAAYRNAEKVLLPDGTELDLPPLSATGTVLHIRPDFYRVYPVRAGEPEHAAFLRALDLYRWYHDEAVDVVARAMWRPGAPAGDQRHPEPTDEAAAAAPAIPVPAAAVPREPARSWAEIRRGFITGAATPTPARTPRSEGDRLNDSDLPF